MHDLKIYYDSVHETEATVQKLAQELDELVHEASEESMAKALALKPALDAALAKHDEAVALYESIQKTNRPNDVAKNFVPISNISPLDGGNQQPTVITREAYDRLSLVDRGRFIQSGGTVEDVDET